MKTLAAAAAATVMALVASAHAKVYSQSQLSSITGRWKRFHECKSSEATQRGKRERVCRLAHPRPPLQSRIPPATFRPIIRIAGRRGRAAPRTSPATVPQMRSRATPARSLLRLVAQGASTERRSSSKRSKRRRKTVETGRGPIRPATRILQHLSGLRSALTRPTLPSC